MNEHVRRSVEAARAAARQAVSGVKAATDAKVRAVAQADVHLSKPLVPYVPLNDENYANHYKVSGIVDRHIGLHSFPL